MPQKIGRKATVEAKFPLQANKLDEVMTYLRKVQLVASQEELAGYFGVKGKTISNWVTGRVAISIAEKKVFAYDFHIPIPWWDDPSTPLEEVMAREVNPSAPDILGAIERNRQLLDDILTIGRTLMQAEQYPERAPSPLVQQSFLRALRRYGQAAAPHHAHVS